MKNLIKIFLACSIFATSGWETTATTLPDDLVNAIFGENTSQYFTMKGTVDDTTHNVTLTSVTRNTTAYNPDPVTNESSVYPLNISATMCGYSVRVIRSDTPYFCQFNSAAYPVSLRLSDLYVNNLYILCMNATGLVAADLEFNDDVHPTAMRNMFYSCSSLRRVKIKVDTTHLTSPSGYAANSQGLAFMCEDCESLELADISAFDTTSVQGTGVSLYYMFAYCSSLKTLIVSPKFGTNATDSNYWSGMFSNVSGLKIYSTGRGSSIEELFHPSLIGIIKGGTYNGVNYGSGYTADKVLLVTDVPPGYTRPHYDLVIAGTKNEIKSPEDTTILSIDKDAVVAVLTNSGQIKGPDEGSAYFKLYGGAKSATITNKASFAVDSSLSDRYSGKTCYVPSIAVFDTQHITLDDGIQVTTEKADLAKHPEIIGSSSNVVVLATSTESTEPIKISQTGSTPLTVNAAFANDTTGTNLKPRDLEISGKVNLAGDLSKFTNGTLKITNSKFEFKTKKSLPQNVECTDSVVKLPRGADITGRIAAKGRSRLEIRCNHIRSGARISFK